MIRSVGGLVSPGTRLGLVGGAILVQVVLLAGVQTRPSALPPGSGIALVGLTIGSAILLGADAARYPEDVAATWWRPDWRFWTIGGAMLGANAGLFLAYLLRRREVRTSVGPSGFWKRPAVLGVLITAAGTIVVNLYFAPPDLGLPGTLILLLVVVGVGFTLPAVFYDTRYVLRALSAADKNWLAKGYHYVILAGLPIPGRLLFLVIYLIRRRMLLGEVAGPDESIDRLPTDQPSTEDHSIEDQPSGESSRESEQGRSGE